MTYEHERLYGGAYFWGWRGVHNTSVQFDGWHVALTGTADTYTHINTHAHTPDT